MLATTTLRAPFNQTVGYEDGARRRDVKASATVSVGQAELWPNASGSKPTPLQPDLAELHAEGPILLSETDPEWTRCPPCRCS